MATYIETGSDGFLTYENEPNSAQTLLKNINDVYPAAELAEISSALENIENDINVKDISADITLTADNNCESVTLLKALKTSDAVFLQFNIKPSVDISTAGNVRFIVSGVEISAVPNYRFAMGSDGTDFYFGWMYEKTDDGFKVACKKLVNSVWSASKTIEMSGVFPTGVLEADNQENNQEGE